MTFKWLNNGIILFFTFFLCFAQADEYEKIIIQVNNNPLLVIKKHLSDRLNAVEITSTSQERNIDISHSNNDQGVLALLITLAEALAGKTLIYQQKDGYAYFNLSDNNRIIAVPIDDEPDALQLVFNTDNTVFTPLFFRTPLLNDLISFITNDEISNFTNDEISNFSYSAFDRLIRSSVTQSLRDGVELPITASFSVSNNQLTISFEGPIEHCTTMLQF